MTDIDPTMRQLLAVHREDVNEREANINTLRGQLDWAETRVERAENKTRTVRADLKHAREKADEQHDLAQKRREIIDSLNLELGTAREQLTRHREVLRDLYQSTTGIVEKGLTDRVEKLLRMTEETK